MQNNTAAAVFTVILLILGFAIAGLLYTFTSVLTGETYEIVEDDLDAISSYTSANTSFVASNTTWVTIRPLLRSGEVALYNTSTYTDNTTDFSVNYTTGKVLLTLEVSSESTLHQTTMRAVYQYDDETIKNAVKGGILSNFEAQQEIGSYLPIVALAIIITIVISLIIAGIATKVLGPGSGFGNSGNIY